MGQAASTTNREWRLLAASGLSINRKSLLVNVCFLVKSGLWNPVADTVVNIHQLGKNTPVTTRTAHKTGYPMDRYYFEDSCGFSGAFSAVLSFPVTSFVGVFLCQLIDHAGQADSLSRIYTEISLTVAITE